MKGKKNNKSKANFDYMKLSLETQTRVAESLEQERDRAYDDYEMTQVCMLNKIMYVNLSTVIQVYTSLFQTPRNKLKCPD